MYPLNNGDKMKNPNSALLILFTGMLYGCISATCPMPVTPIASSNKNPTLEMKMSLDGLNYTNQRFVYNVEAAAKAGRCQESAPIVVYDPKNPKAGHTEVFKACDTDGDGKNDYFNSTRIGLGETVPYREVLRKPGETRKKDSSMCVVRDRKINLCTKATQYNIPKEVPCKDVVDASSL